MEKHGEPLIVKFGKDDKIGFTYSQLITTSNICCHYCDNNMMFLDVFSCKKFNEQTIIDYIKEFYGTENTKITSRFNTRG